MFSNLSRCLLGVLVLALMACASNSPTAHPEYPKLKKEVAKAIQGVRNSEDLELYNHLQHLVAYDVFAADQVLKLAQDPNSRLRANAMWVLSQIDDPSYPRVMARVERALQDGLRDADRLVRYEAAVGLVARNDWDAIPHVMEGLSDANALVRHNCHQALVTATSQDFGYQVDSSEEDRVAAIEKWQSWYSDWQAQDG